MHYNKVFSFGLNIIVDCAIYIFEDSNSYSLSRMTEFKFMGSGVYGIFYTPTENSFYKNCTGLDRPIYVGKAVPPGWRNGRTTNKESYTLYKRLCEHAKSISQVDGLDIGNFLCKIMTIDSNLITAVESALIRRYRPIWNTIGGFGNHNIGSTRRMQKISEFDLIHPGRPWANGVRDEERYDQVIGKIIGFNDGLDLRRRFIPRVLSKIIR